MKIYLDNAATTPLSKEVLDEMMPFLTTHYGNPSAIHSFGRTTRSAIEKARKQVANALHCSPSEVFFTSSGTEANNMAIKRAVQDLGVQHIITSPIEHHCVSHTVEYAEKTYGIHVHLLDVSTKGAIDLKQLSTKLNELKGEKVLVTLMHANNEIGTMLDFEGVTTLCSEFENVYLHTDTVQTIGHYRFDLQKTKINFMSGSGHKLHGPKGIGFIYINSSTSINPFIHGGSQERNMRAGTENVYGIVGLGKAVEIAYTHYDEYKNQISALKKYMMEKVEENFIDIDYHGDVSDNSLYTVLNISFPPSDKNEMLLMNLDIAGIAASGGSACTSGAEAGSHVLTAIGANPLRKGIRFSFSHQNTKEEIDTVIEKLKTLVSTKELVK